MRTRRGNRLFLVPALVAALVTGLAAAAPASVGSAAPTSTTTLPTREARTTASLPACTGSMTVRSGGLTTTMPAYLKPPVGSQAPQYSYECYLWQGHKGNGVRTLQQALNNCYKLGIGVDGDFGRITHQAVYNVQLVIRASGRDGTYRPETRKKMEWKMSNGSCRTLNI